MKKFLFLILILCFTMSVSAHAQSSGKTLVVYFSESGNTRNMANIIGAIGEKHGKTAAQVILRWHQQRGIIAIPKSTHKERIVENFAISDFTLSDEDMSIIDLMDLGRNLILDIRTKEEVERLYNIKVING